MNQANFSRFLETAEDYTDDEKLAFIVAVDECGYSVRARTMQTLTSTPI